MSCRCNPKFSNATTTSSLTREVVVSFVVFVMFVFSTSQRWNLWVSESFGVDDDEEVHNLVHEFRQHTSHTYKKQKNFSILQWIWI